MRIQTCLLIACALVGASCGQRPSLGSWNSKLGLFRWENGEVTLPGGFKYRRTPSDTFEGHFTSADGKLVIRHDIGGYAGAYASRRTAFFFEERVVEGARVWIAKTDRPNGMGVPSVLVAVTFPDSGCANFFLDSTKPEDATLIESVARSFRPKGRADPGPLCR